MKTVISLTSIPDRIAHIEPCIRSLVAQGLPVYLWAVRKIERSSTVLEEVPAFLNELKVHVEIVEDCGPITKLLPALKAGFDTIITADDDCIYGERWASHLLTWSKRIPRAALGYRGRILKGDTYRDSRLVLKSRIKKVVAVDMITGVYGALYKRKFFDKGIFEEWKRWPMNDELVITAHLKRKGIRRYVVPAKCKITDTRTRSIAPLYGMNTSAFHLNDEGMRVLGLEKKRK
jgi:hypothetical protein